MNFSWLKDLQDVELMENTEMARFTTIRLRAMGSVAIVSSEEALAKLVRKLSEKNIPFHVLGWGANQVISKTAGVLFIKLQLPFDRDLLRQPREKYELPASLALNALQSHAVRFGVKGWEVFTGIPASLGGAIYMNAGTSLGEIGQVVESVKIMTPLGGIRSEVIGSESFSYRKNHFVKEGEIILGAVLFHKGLDPAVSKTIKDYMKLRKRTQPLRSFNCGCVWKNKDADRRAGLYVDKSGLSNLAVGDMEVSDLHANFFENKGEASFEDFQRLASLLEDQLLLHTGIRFEMEAKVY